MQVFSLICWGGRTGKTVTLTIASPCVVTSTNHGLRDGTGLVFSTTGALPTGITAGTTYYARYVAENTFHLYDTEAHAKDTASTTGRINTSGTQSGTHTAKSRLMLDYFDQYPTRWWDEALEAHRCYDSVVTWLQSRASASALDTEVCELGQSFVDERTDSTIPVFNLPAARTLVTPTIDGVFTEAFHFGVIGQGYELYRKSYGYNCLQMTGRRITLFGFTAKVFLGYYGYQVINCISWDSLIRGMIVIGGGGVAGYGTTEDGILLASNSIVAENNLVLGCLRGIKIMNYTTGLIIAGNTLVQNATGMAPVVATNIYGDFYNNVCIGNGTNWGAITYNANMSCGYNAGLEGEAWVTGSHPRFTVATTDFESFPTDMRPAAGASVIDAGIEYFEIATADLAGNERPNYNNGGAEAFDVGCYEFDHGYGDHPASTTVTFSGVHAGSEIRVYDSEGNELAGVESSTANPELTWVLSTGDVRVVVVHLNYKIKDFQYTPVAGAVSLPVQQEADSWYSNP